MLSVETKYTTYFGKSLKDKQGQTFHKQCKATKGIKQICRLISKYLIPLVYCNV